MGMESINRHTADMICHDWRISWWFCGWWLRWLFWWFIFMADGLDFWYFSSWWFAAVIVEHFSRGALPAWPLKTPCGKRMADRNSVSTSRPIKPARLGMVYARKMVTTGDASCSCLEVLTLASTTTNVLSVAGFQRELSGWATVGS